MDAGNIFERLANGDNPLVAVLAFLVIVLAGVNAIQWRYTIYNTVPKWAWEEMVESLNELVGLVKKLDTLLELIVRQKIK